MSIYEKPAVSALKQIEVHLYGSSRLGIATALTAFPDSVTLDGGYAPAAHSTFTRGEKIFEITNHLGNVLATVTDRKLQHTTDSTDVDYYEPDILTAVDLPGVGQLHDQLYSSGRRRPDQD